MGSELNDTRLVGLDDFAEVAVADVVDDRPEINLVQCIEEIESELQIGLISPKPREWIVLDHTGIDIEVAGIAEGVPAFITFRSRVRCSEVPVSVEYAAQVL